MTALVVEFARIEVANLAELVRQFCEVLEAGSSGDDAVLRLVPDGYADDPAAAKEFRSLTERELLDRRREDAEVVLAALEAADDLPSVGGYGVLAESVGVTVTADDADSWLRTLASVRLVLATRLGIDDTDDHDPADPRFGVYDWLGYRLDTLVRALDDI